MKQTLIHCCAGVLIGILCVGCNELKQDRQQPQPVQVSNVELAATLSLEVGAKQTLMATILPADAENRTVSWKSEDTSIATVSSSGEVTAEGAGETTITATTADGEKTARCTVTVTAKTEQEQEPEPELQGTFPIIDIPEEVSAFFDDNIYWISNAALSPRDEYLIDSCVMINSVDELSKVKIDSKFPVIDFDSYTLVVGSFVTGNGLTYLASQSIVVSHDIATINLILDYKRGDVDGTTSVEPKGFWGLYPKITAKSINMNITQPSW